VSETVIRGVASSSSFDEAVCPHAQFSLTHALSSGLRFGAASMPSLPSLQSPRQLHALRTVMMAAPAQISFGALEGTSAPAPSAKKTGAFFFSCSEQVCHEHVVGAQWWRVLCEWATTVTPLQHLC
jgi:hypothetical protein